MRGMHVNYYEHHLGDYALATSHLSWDEDMAYSRMLRLYYQTEQPLPKNPDDIARKISANTSSRKKSILRVLQDFFELREDGWHQKRCDKEIERLEIKRENARSNGKVGGRPKNQEKPRLVILETHSQTPDSRLQSPVLDKISSPIGEVLEASPPTTSKRSWIEQAKDVLDFLNWKLAKAWKATSPKGGPTAHANMVMSRLKDGYTPEDCKAVATLKIEQWFDDDKMRAYIRPKTLYSKANFETYIGETKRLPEEELRRIRVANGFQPVIFQPNGGSEHAH